MLDKIYKEIVKQRNKRLEKSKEVGDYEFVVAHGMTECLRIIDKIEEDLKNKK